jgi:4-hydroxybutyryl-CoA dehydratase/vinylacetyl-CoA-Delta-isomerase
LTAPTVENIAETYRLALDEPKLFTAVSHITGETIIRYTHIPRSSEDMVARIKMDRRVSNLTGLSNYRSTGADALICLESITHQVDQEKGTSYHQRYRHFLSEVQGEDLVVGGTVTDTKGDRSLRPHQQPNPDVYLHVVEEKEAGIVVKGAKICQSGGGVFDELLVMPTRALSREDADYAVAFAVPNQSPGLFHILARQPGNASRLTGGAIDHGNPFAGHETLAVFDRVLIPWDRVFLLREWQVMGQAVELFASFHRVCYSGAVVGYLDLVIGAAALMARMNGVLDSAHVRDKLAEMIAHAETIHACGLAAAAEGHYSSSGAYVINHLFANLCKLNITKNVYEIFRMAHDITGGLIACSPSQKDLENPEIGPYIRHYLVGAEPFEATDRIKVARLIEAITMGPLLGVAMHGSGSPQAQKITITRQKDMEELIDLAADLARVQHRFCKQNPSTIKP